MANWSLRGMDGLLASFQKLSNKKIEGKVLYDGADVVADAFRKELDAIPTEDKYVQTKGAGFKRKGIRTIEKVGLINGFGVAKHETRGDVRNTSIGVHGYNKFGKANRMILASLNKGTTTLKKYPIARRVALSSKQRAMQAMEKRVEIEIEKAMNK